MLSYPVIQGGNSASLILEIQKHLGTNPKVKVTRKYCVPGMPLAPVKTETINDKVKGVAQGENGCIIVTLEKIGRLELPFSLDPEDVCFTVTKGVLSFWHPQGTYTLSVR